MSSKVTEVVKLRTVYGDRFEVRGNRLVNVVDEVRSRTVAKGDLKKFFKLSDTSTNANHTVYTKYVSIPDDTYWIGQDHHIFIDSVGRLQIGCMIFSKVTTAKIKAFALSSTKSNTVKTSSRKAA